MEEAEPPLVARRKSGVLCLMHRSKVNIAEIERVRREEVGVCVSVRGSHEALVKE